MRPVSIVCLCSSPSTACSVRSCFLANATKSACFSCEVCTKITMSTLSAGMVARADSTNAAIEVGL